MKKTKEEEGWRPREIRTKGKGNKISERVIIHTDTNISLPYLNPRHMVSFSPLVFSFLMPNPFPAFLNVYVVYISLPAWHVVT